MARGRGLWLFMTMRENSRRPRVVAGEVVANIRDEVRSHYRAGRYPPEIASELEGLYGDGDAGPPFDAELAALREVQFSPEIEAASNKRVIAPLVAGTKRTIRGGLRWYTNALLEQFETFARRTITAVEVLGARLDALESRHAKATKELEASIHDEIGDARRKNRDALARSDDIAAALEDLRSAVERLERRLQRPNS